MLLGRPVEILKSPLPTWMGMTVWIDGSADFWAFLAAVSIESRLTTGLSEYPPPRNKAAGAKGTEKELRTVEQGRSS